MSDAALNPQKSAVQMTVYPIIFSVSICHMLNDIMQSMLSAIYPMLKTAFTLEFWQIGLLTLVFQVTASLLQPVVGIVTDKRPLPMSLPVGMGSTFCGLLVLAWAPSYQMVLLGAGLVGIGSAIFHPEASRVARMASGGKFGLAQSVFQVGGNFGTAIGPLLAAFIVVPFGRGSVAWFSLAALLGIFILTRVGFWDRDQARAAKGRKPADKTLPLSGRRVFWAIVVLAMLMFSKNIYMASIGSYFTFYLIETFSLSTQGAQVMLFVFLGGAAAGTVFGGPLGDRFGKLTVIWISILGVLPLTLMLPMANLFWTGILSAAIGFIMAGSFPAIVVFAQELLPGRVGMVAGIFFGLSFGSGGVAAAALGVLADAKGLSYVYGLCAWMPALGLLAVFLPRRRHFIGA